MISLVALENLVKENEERVNIQKRQLADHESGHNRLSRVSLASTESNLEKATDDLLKYSTMLAELLEQDRAEVEEKERLEAAIQRKKYFENQHIRIQDNTQRPNDQKLEAMRIIDELPSEVGFEDEDLFKIAAKAIELNITNHNDLAEKLTTINKEFKSLVKNVKDPGISELGMLDFQIPIIILHFSVLYSNIIEVLEENRQDRIEKLQKRAAAERALANTKRLIQAVKQTKEVPIEEKIEEKKVEESLKGESSENVSTAEIEKIEEPEEEEEKESLEEIEARKLEESKLEEIFKEIEFKEKSKHLFRGFPKYEDWWIHEMWSSHQAYFALYKWKEIINNLCVTNKQKLAWSGIFDSWIFVKKMLNVKSELAFEYNLAFDKLIKKYAELEEELADDNLASMEMIIKEITKKENFGSFKPNHKLVTPYLEFKRVELEDDKKKKN